MNIPEPGAGKIFSWALRTSDAPGNGRYCLSRWWRLGEELALFFIRRRGPWNQLDRRKGLDIRGLPPKSVAFVAASRASLPVLETVVEGVLSHWAQSSRLSPYSYPHQVSEVLSLLSLD